MKTRYQVPKGLRTNRYFWRIEHDEADIFSSYCYSRSLNAWIHERTHRKMLYNGIPCCYTDKRFKDDLSVELYLNISKRHGVSLKTAKRQLQSCAGIRAGMRFYLPCMYELTSNNLDFGVWLSPNPTNAPKYAIDAPLFFESIPTEGNDPKRIELAVRMRHEGYLVEVHDQHNVLAFGNDKEILIPLTDDDQKLYTNHAKGAILWGRSDEFNKWSMYNRIPDTLSITQILQALKGEDISIIDLPSNTTIL